ncbi:response regulator [Caenispirillum salinarum]|uniref:response regulator n=1 Tax=Caenispirillum salinarum TaxID=859058 RepID=UPI00384DA698
MTDDDRLSGLRVLLVEDEALVAMYVEDLLEDAGCEIVGPAPRLDAALSAIATDPMDLAILDVNLKGEQVWPAADALKARGVPYVFLTGYAADTVPGAHAGVTRLTKPLRPSDLFSTLYAVTGR